MILFLRKLKNYLFQMQLKFGVFFWQLIGLFLKSIFVVRLFLEDMRKMGKKMSILYVFFSECYKYSLNSLKPVPSM